MDNFISTTSLKHRLEILKKSKKLGHVLLNTLSDQSIKFQKGNFFYLMIALWCTLISNILYRFVKTPSTHPEVNATIVKVNSKK